VGLAVVRWDFAAQRWGPAAQPCSEEESRFTQRQEWRPLDAGNVCSVRFCWQRWGRALLRYPKRALGRQLDLSTPSTLPGKKRRCVLSAPDASGRWNLADNGGVLLAGASISASGLKKQNPGLN